MNSSLLLAIACVFILVIGAVVALVIMLLKPNLGRSKDAKAISANTAKPTRKGWQSWLLPVGIALILLIWTFWGALFFLAVVWVLRMDPSPDASFTVSKNEQNTAKRIYTWLFWSPIFTVPIFMGIALNLSNSATINERVLSALVPLILHAFLLLGMTSKSAFVYRHTQQGILLIALRAGTASLAISMGSSPYDGLGLFFLSNGALWLIGSIVGWNQIFNSKCWFMDRKGETIILMDIENKKIVTPESQTIQPNEADKKLEQFLTSMNTYEKQITKEKALEAFRSGILGEVRKNAVNILSILGEVEKF